MRARGRRALHEIVDGVFAWVQPDGTWWINNAGAITAVGDDGTHPGGTVVVDTCATTTGPAASSTPSWRRPGRHRSRWR